MLDCAIIIPARLSSQRFPRKLLHKIHGKPLILWTADQLKSANLDWPVYFAVEDEELAEILKQAGYEVIRTGIHPSGTDRIAEANQQIGADIVINIQADEPLTSTQHVKKLHEAIRKGADMATLAHPFKSVEDFHNPNRVKVVCSEKGRALYFSRAPIPYPREEPDALPSDAFLHLGMYAYTSKFLKDFSALKPGALEQTEKLEQLRALENGFSIQVGITDELGFGVDTPEDADRLEVFLQK